MKKLTDSKSSDQMLKLLCTTVQHSCFPQSCSNRLWGSFFGSFLEKQKRTI